MCIRDSADTVLWLTGDIETEAEQQLLTLIAAERAPVALKVAHHGGGSSSSSELLSALQPSIAMISAGRNNIYGHPAEQTVDRLSQAGATINCTNQVGAIRLRSDGKQWIITTCLAIE